ncbi:NAD(P)-dependent dehydrogenase (short-subunit alcohol dehydrogenase family) [Paenibacillus phyllosphaerae]|uniref:NAD(P)-dependent dehydrogenase (Short-subunit alcohol dehydrogenase family) n=1 Tax=Paenibacillus phyllosphaerae TaxID=274593 RepID=A0A7W5FR08_9BACL|nr:SDR family oxidoreductase [Paenibacillus phyllosphaerae]MBB3114026.1 NAD(P)-dependent dehydrogenase (short-subunit alcohol dehydrogenase family) [Paenibacillus phyllosphaerae]
MELGLKDKLVLVTGSTGGIGKGTAISFLQEGARVIINGRTEKGVNAAVQELAAFGTVYGIAADVSKAEESQLLVEKVNEIGSLDVLVNNTGIFEVKPFADVTDEEWIDYYQTNVLSAVRLSRAFLPGMIERNWGRIINLASEAGIKPYPELIPYGVSKTSLITLSRGLAELAKGTGVTVNSVLPGPTWTEGFAKFITDLAQEKGQELEPFIREYFQDSTPTSLIQRFATVEEVADTIVFLSSVNAGAINGHAQRVEGGIIQSIL